MNPELKNLVDAALTDGYLSDKEREVLKRKATKLGFDIDELDILLDGKLHQFSRENRPNINKCPNCGDIISGFSRICKSCDYIVNSTDQEDFESLEESFHELEELVDDLKREKKDLNSSPLLVANLKIIFTSGFYIIYKKLIKREHLYDSYRAANRTAILETSVEVDKLRRKYGNNIEVNKAIDALIAQRDLIISGRRKADRLSGITGLVVICVIIYLFISIANKPPAPLTAEEKTEKLIDEKKISEARTEASMITDESAKKTFLTTINLLEADSLINTGNYNEALKIVNLMEDDYYDLRKNKIDEIITKQVTELIAAKDYKKAREQAKLADYFTVSKLEEQINLAEKLK